MAAVSRLSGAAQLVRAAALIPLLGWAATIAEVVPATLLLVGWRLPVLARLSGGLPLVFAVTVATASDRPPPLLRLTSGL